MPLSLPAILFALTTFVVTFVVARLLRKWFMKRKAGQMQAQALAAETRQMRRARERKSGPR
ncbi:MAG: hypothetical protein V4669_16730 [Pseudomonadota bacterium]